MVQKLTGLQLVKKFPAFHGTRWFITALTSLRHLFLSWTNPIQSIYPHPTFWSSILILSTHLRLGLPSSFVSRASIPHWMFLNKIFLQGRFVRTSPNPQVGVPPLVSCPRLLIQFIRSYPPYRRPILYPQPEDMPWRGDRDPLHGFKCNYPYSKKQHYALFTFNLFQ